MICISYKVLIISLDWCRGNAFNVRVFLETWANVRVQMQPPSLCSSQSPSKLRAATLIVAQEWKILKKSRPRRVKTHQRDDWDCKIFI